jgi:hypothetical protein
VSLATQLEAVAPNVGYTGPGAGVVGAIDNTIEAVTGREGLRGNSGARGAFTSLAMEAQLAFTEKTKGAITDREMGSFREAAPNSGQTPEANQMIARVMRAGAERVRTRTAFFENWARKNGSLEGAEEVWSDFMEENPVITSEGGRLTVQPDGNINAYLNRKPLSAYTPEAISQMSAAELAQVPIERMTDAQLSALESRFMQIGSDQ